MMKSSSSGAVTSLANQGDTSGPGGESNGHQPSCTFGRSCDDAKQADGRAGTKDKINLRHSIRTGTWNVRSMTDPSKLHILQREMERYNIPICGLAEVRWTGKGHFLLAVNTLSTTQVQIILGGIAASYCLEIQPSVC